MERFLFAADLALGTDQSTLASGQLAIFVETQDGNVKYWATGDAVKRFCIMVGGPAKRGIIATPYMDARPASKTMKKASPVAGVQQEDMVKFAAKGDGTMGSAADDEFIVTVDLRGGMDLFGNESQTRTYVVRGIFANETALYNALATQINTNDTIRDITARVTGTGGTLGLYITTAAKYKSASLFTGGYHAPASTITTPQVATITTPTDLVLGAGDVADAIRYDVRQQASLGNYYQVDSELPQIQGLVIADGSTFKSLLLRVRDVHHTTDMQAHGNEVYANTVIFMPNSATTNYTNLIAALEEILAGTFVASAF